MRKTSGRLPTHSVDESEGSRQFVSTGFHGNKLKIWTERSTTLTLLKIATIPSITVQRMGRKKKKNKLQDYSGSDFATPPGCAPDSSFSEPEPGAEQLASSAL